MVVSKQNFIFVLNSKISVSNLHDLYFYLKKNPSTFSKLSSNDIFLKWVEFDLNKPLLAKKLINKSQDEFMSILKKQVYHDDSLKLKEKLRALPDLSCEKLNYSYPALHFIYKEFLFGLFLGFSLALIFSILLFDIFLRLI